MLDGQRGREGHRLVATLGEALSLYVSEYRATLRASSARRAIDTCTKFVQFVGPSLAPRELCREHVRTFRDARATSCSRATVTSDLGRVRAFVNFMRSEEPPLLEHDPTFKVSPPVAGDDEEDDADARGLSVEEEAVVVNALAGHQTYLDWCVLGTCIGARPGEQGHVRGIDWDHGRRLLDIRSYPGWKLKTKASRRKLEVTEQAAEILTRRKLAAGNPSALLFSNRNGKPYSLNCLRKQIQRLLPEGQFFTLYALRHTFAYRVVESGSMDVAQLKLYLGQANLHSTERYFRGADTSRIAAPAITAAQPYTASPEVVK